MTIAIHQPDTDLIAARMAGHAPANWTLQTDLDAACRLADHLRTTMGALQGERDAAVRDEQHRARHMVAMLKRFAAIHARMQAALRPPQYGPASKDDGTSYTDAQYAALSKAFREAFAEMGEEIAEEMRGMGE